MRRVVVIGPAGSGKSTLAAALARHLAVPHVELDSLFWGPNWQAASDTPEGQARFRRRVEEATAGDGWVADGNYSSVRTALWPRADTIVWLDYPLPVVLWRLLRRTVRRMFTRQLLWDTNRETFRDSFFARDSLLRYTLRTHRSRRTGYEETFARGDATRAKVIRLRSPAEADAWLAHETCVRLTPDSTTRAPAPPASAARAAR